ncbi:MAG: glycosyltransferase family 4 protein [Desulfobacterales bacterium]|jgi:glycosyltransferase involved in cell wall biosynthesis
MSGITRHQKYSKGPTETSKPLNICLLSYRCNPHCGGQGVYLKNLSRALKDLGHRVDVVVGPPDPQLDVDIPFYRIPSLDLYNPDNLFRTPSLKELRQPINLMEWIGVSTMGFPEPFTFGLRARRWLRKKRYRYDVVHDNQGLSYALLTIKDWLPTVATIHHPITIDRKIAIRSAVNIWRKMQQWRWYSFCGMQKRVARKLSHIITVSKTAQNDIARDFGISTDRFSIIPNGIRTDLFYPIPEIPRAKNSLIVTNSADMPLKGLLYLLRAVSLVAQTLPVKLTIVGAAHKNGYSHKLIQQLGIGNRVTFTGRITNEQFVRLYAKATAAVIPSVYEGFGLPVGEAMACGVPVISTTGGALPEIVGDAGILVPPADHHALAVAILAVLQQPHLAHKLSHAGYQRVQRHFTWIKAAQKTVNVYRKVIHDHH